MGGIGVMSWVCLGVFCISSAIHHAYARAPKARCPASKKQSLLSDCFFLTLSLFWPWNLISLFFSCPLFKSFHIARQTGCSKRITVLYPHLIYSGKKRISFQFQEQSSSKVVFLCSTRTSRCHKLKVCTSVHLHRCTPTPGHELVVTNKSCFIKGEREQRKRKSVRSRDVASDQLSSVSSGCQNMWYVKFRPLLVVLWRTD